MSEAIKTDSELKGLRTRRDQLIPIVDQALKAANVAQHEYNTKKGELDSLKARIAELEKPKSAAEVIVSEHAYLRWIERAMGFDLAEIRKVMLSPRIEAAIHACGGNCTIKTEQGYKLVVKNKTVVSVVEDGK